MNNVSLQDISTSRRDESLNRRAQSSHDLMLMALSNCEDLLVNSVTWVNALPKNADDYGIVMNESAFGWMFAMRDPSCGGVAAMYLANGLMIGIAASPTRTMLLDQPCYPLLTPGCMMAVKSFSISQNRPVATMYSTPGSDQDFSDIFKLGLQSRFESGLPSEPTQSSLS